MVNFRMNMRLFLWFKLMSESLFTLKYVIFCKIEKIKLITKGVKNDILCCILSVDFYMLIVC